MNKKTKLHFRRFEFKYELPLNLADKIIPALTPHMDWDPYAINHPDYAYRVTSLYFDTLNLKNYWEKVNGLKYRKKLRIRFYDQVLSNDTPAFIEYKRKDDVIVKKDRVQGIWKDWAEMMMNGKGCLLKRNFITDKDFFNELQYDLARYHLKPAVWVQYLRKPLIGRGKNNLRVTFDYNLKVKKANDMIFTLPDYRVFTDKLIMEIKFNRFLPGWLHQIIKKFQLTRGAHSKYCYGIDRVYNLVLAK